MELRGKLQSELPGILAWAVGGAQAYFGEGLGKSAAVDGATAVYRSDMDTLSLFLSQTCTIDAKTKEPTTVVLAAYNTGAVESGEDAISSRLLSNKLKDHCFVPFRTRYGRGFCGLCSTPSGGAGDASDTNGVF